MYACVYSVENSAEHVTRWILRYAIRMRQHLFTRVSSIVMREGARHASVCAYEPTRRLCFSCYAHIPLAHTSMSKLSVANGLCVYIHLCV